MAVNGAPEVGKNRGGGASGAADTDHSATTPGQRDLGGVAHEIGSVVEVGYPECAGGDDRAHRTRAVDADCTALRIREQPL